MDRNKTDIYKAIASCIFDNINDYIEEEQNSCLIDVDILLQLSELPISGQNFIKNEAGNFLTLNIDQSAISHALKKWYEHQQDYELEDQFLILQAPQKLMRDLFGMHATTFSWRRRLLGLQGHGKHRPFYCDTKTEARIWELWYQFRDLDERERYLKVSGLSDLSINVIAAAVKRYNEAALRRE